jgi:hypothetical protein
MDGLRGKHLTGYRIRVVCEDKLTWRYAKSLIEKAGAAPMTPVIAPAGEGSGYSFVLRQAVDELKTMRSLKYQENFAVLAIVDGDNEGPRRVHDFPATKDDERIDQLGNKEKFVWAVPTWSIETWLLSRAESSAQSETTRFKTQMPRDAKELAAIIAAATTHGLEAHDFDPPSFHEFVKDAARRWPRVAK